MFTAIDRTGHLAGGVADVIHVWRGVSLPVCVENANNVRCLGCRESITLTVSHLCPLGRKGARLGAENQKEKNGRKSEGKGRLARTFGKSVCVLCRCVRVRGGARTQQTRVTSASAPSS